jgi:hypothetical protein
MTHVVAEPTSYCSHLPGSCEFCAPTVCEICGNHVGAEAHAFRGWVCPDCCPRCGLVSLVMGYKGTENEIENLADVIADGALDDDDIATVMGVES